MLPLFRFGHNADRVALVILGKVRNRLRHGGRKQQRLTLFRCLAQDELKIFAETEIQHLVCLVQHHRAQCAEVDGTPRDVIAQTARRRDNDVRATFKCPTLVAHVHAADTGRQLCACFTIKPGQLPFHLQRQFTRRRDHQGQRRGSRFKRFSFAQHSRRNRQAKAHGLA